jgi:uncharacterized protein YxeA
MVDVVTGKRRDPMKRVLIALVLVVLVACATGLFFTYRSLGATQSALQETKSSLQATQVNLQDSAAHLEKTRLELQDTSQSMAKTQQDLAETRQELDEQKGQTERYVQLYEGGLEELESQAQELDALTEKYELTQQENQELQKEVDEITSKLELFEDTMGVQVFSGVQPPYGSGNLLFISLRNQSNARNPSWNELEAFLQEDKTDKNLYVPGVYECGNYAQDLHNNAEAKGIRAAFVAVYFHNDEPHALNAFKTGDRGLVYIDVTGTTKPLAMANLDREVILEKDKRYSAHLLFPGAYELLPVKSRVKSIEIYW